MKFVLLLASICSVLHSGWCVTDEDLARIEALVATLKREVDHLRNENRDAHVQIQLLKNRVEDLENENPGGQDQIQILKTQMENLTREVQGLKTENQNLRAALQGVQQDVTGVEMDVVELSDRMNDFDEGQIDQNKRMYNLGQDAQGLKERVEALESSGGGGGGDVTALERRVETLEGTAAAQKAVIEDLGQTTTDIDGRVDTLEGQTSELETRLTSAETQIEVMKAMDAELETRIANVETAAGGSGSTVAFRAAMTDPRTGFLNIPVGTTVKFGDVELNEGSGYNPATGVFTVPSGKGGYYYFANYFLILRHRYAYMDLRVNDVTVCSVHNNNDDIDTWSKNGGCSAVVFLSEGDRVQNVYRRGKDSHPVYESGTGVYNGFTGFKI